MLRSDGKSIVVLLRGPKRGDAEPGVTEKGMTEQQPVEIRLRNSEARVRELERQASSLAGQNDRLASALTCAPWCGASRSRSEPTWSVAG